MVKYNISLLNVFQLLTDVFYTMFSDTDTSCHLKLDVGRPFLLLQQLTNQVWRVNSQNTHEEEVILPAREETAAIPTLIDSSKFLMGLEKKVS